MKHFVCKRNSQERKQYLKFYSVIHQLFSNLQTIEQVSVAASKFGAVIFNGLYFIIGVVCLIKQDGVSHQVCLCVCECVQLSLYLHVFFDLLLLVPQLSKSIDD